jgi:hypothetical protein
MTSAKFVSDLHSKGITLAVKGDKLKCKSKEAPLTPELLETLRERKAELIALLAGMCFCEPPMPPADIDSLACQHCGIASWCATCGGCRWCSFEVKWKSNLEPKWRRGNRRVWKSQEGYDNEVL